jgi:ComF family protein
MSLGDSLIALTGALKCAACGTRGPLLCAHCEGRLRPAGSMGSVAAVDRVVVAFEYEEVARDLVLALKLRGNRSAAEPLAAALHASAAADGLVGRTITWVPGRISDIRRRGFDHARVLAEAVARVMGLPATDLIKRIRAAPDQSGLAAAARRTNLLGVFTAFPCDGTIVLIDDLVTTGATAEACGRALKKSGAARVELLAACRKSRSHLV